VNFEHETVAIGRNLDLAIGANPDILSGPNPSFRCGPNPDFYSGSCGAIGADPTLRGINSTRITAL